MSSPRERRRARKNPPPPEHGRAGRVERISSSFWSGYDLLWGLTPTPAPARRGAALDRTRIARTAIRIADAEGLDAVTMRRVAQELRTGAMSLYRHVPDKDALVSVMIDTILGDPARLPADRQAQARRPVPDPREWRASLRMLAESTWRVCRAHPWYPEASMVRPPLTPNALAGLDWALSIFDGYDLPIGTKMHYVGAVHFGVLSAALSLTIEERARERFGLSEQGMFAASAPFMQRALDSGDYPRVADFVRNAEHAGDEEQMRAGVELILDGIGARLGLAARDVKQPESSRRGRPRQEPR